MDKKDKEDKAPIFWFCLIGIMCIAALIVALSNLAEGLWYAFIEGGWRWLLFIVLPLSIYLFIVMSNRY